MGMTVLLGSSLTRAEVKDSSPLPGAEQFRELRTGMAFQLGSTRAVISVTGRTPNRAVASGWPKASARYARPFCFQLASSVMPAFSAVPRANRPELLDLPKHSATGFDAANPVPVPAVNTRKPNRPIALRLVRMAKCTFGLLLGPTWRWADFGGRLHLSLELEQSSYRLTLPLWGWDIEHPFAPLRIRLLDLPAKSWKA
jgi:hypothetical protein